MLMTNKACGIARAWCISLTLLSLGEQAWSGALATTLQEYNQLTRERKIQQSQYRSWFDRIEQAVRDDRNASRDDVFEAKVAQLALANDLGDFESTLRLGDEAAQLAPTAEAGLFFRHQGTLAALALRRQRAGPGTDDELVLSRLLDLRRMVESPGGLLEKSGNAASWAPFYVATLAAEAGVRRDRREFQEALTLYTRANQLLEDRKWPSANESLDRNRETWLFNAILCALEMKNTAEADSLLSRLTKLDSRKNPMGHYILEIARAEDPQRGAAFQSRLKTWLQQSPPTERMWLDVATTLGNSQRTSVEPEMLVASAETYELILRAEGKFSKAEGSGWRAAQLDAWYHLATVHANPAAGRLYDPKRAREYASKFLAATERGTGSSQDVSRRTEMQALME